VEVQFGGPRQRFSVDNLAALFPGVFPPGAPFPVLVGKKKRCDRRFTEEKVEKGICRSRSKRRQKLKPRKSLIWRAPRKQSAASYPRLNNTAAAVPSWGCVVDT